MKDIYTFLMEVDGTKSKLIIEFTALMIQSYMDLTEYERLEQYENCSLQLKMIEKQVDFYANWMNDYCTRARTKQNREYLELIQHNVKNRIMNE